MRAQFIPRHQYRSRVAIIIEKKPEIEDLVVSWRVRDANAGYGFRRGADYFHSRSHVDRVDPTRRALWSRIRRRMLTQISPRAFRVVLCGRSAFLRQTVVKSFLS